MGEGALWHGMVWYSIVWYGMVWLEGPLAEPHFPSTVWECREAIVPLTEGNSQNETGDKFETQGSNSNTLKLISRITGNIKITIIFLLNKTNKKALTLYYIS